MSRPGIHCVETQSLVIRWIQPLTSTIVLWDSNPHEQRLEASFHPLGLSLEVPQYLHSVLPEGCCLGCHILEVSIHLRHLCIFFQISNGQKRKPSSLRIYKRSSDLDHTSPTDRSPHPALQRHSSDLDHRSKVKAQLQGQKREKEGRYRASDSKDLKLPR